MKEEMEFYERLSEGDLKKGLHEVLRISDRYHGALFFVHPPGGGGLRSAPATAARCVAPFRRMHGLL